MDKPILSLRNVSKHFGDFCALKAVDFDLQAGEVHCLVGENGCGKSTLIKIISGVYTPDDGASIQLHGQTAKSVMTPQAARQNGIHVIWQDLALFPHLSVAENISFDDFVEKRWQKPRSQSIRDKAKRAMERLGIDIDPDLPLSELNIAQRQLIAICRVLIADARIIFMDEPTASLTRKEVEHLLDAVRKMQADGISVVFVSHRLAEVLDVAERVTVIRDGEIVGVWPASDLTQKQLIEHMTGMDIEDKTRPLQDFTQPVLTLDNLSRQGEYQDINLTLHRGEIIGITGLLGSGRTELALSLFGMTRPDSGDMVLNGKLMHFDSNRDAIAAGIAYVSEDRLNLGLIQPQSIRDNTVMAILRRLDPTGYFLKPRRLQQTTTDWVQRLKIKSHNTDLPVSSLSGGNQQRIVLSKWLATEPQVLILDAPTVGVDVGAKAGIFETINALAEQGLSIIIISDEVTEVYYHCDRVFVMRDGYISEAFYPAKSPEHALEEVVYG